MKRILGTFLLLTLLLTACAPSRTVGGKEVVEIRFTSGAADAGQLEEWMMRTHIASADDAKRAEKELGRRSVSYTNGAQFNQYIAKLQALESEEYTVCTAEEMMGFPIWEEWYFPSVVYSFADGTTVGVRLYTADPDFVNVRGEAYGMRLSVTQTGESYFFKSSAAFSADEINRIALGE